MSSQWFTTLIPPYQYFLFNIGFMLLFITVVGIPISHELNHNKEIDLYKAVRIGFSSWIGLSCLYDLLQPPYYLDISGNIVLNVPSALTGTAVDATLVWFWQQLGVSGSLLFYFVYLITPLILIFAIVALLSGKQLINVFRKFG